MKQTAVDWLQEELKGVYESDYFNKLLEQAKAMEKEQMRAVHIMTYMNKDFDFEQYIKDHYEQSK
jgi:hypothetical protein